MSGFGTKLPWKRKSSTCAPEPKADIGRRVRRGRSIAFAADIDAHRLRANRVHRSPPHLRCNWPNVFLAPALSQAQLAAARQHLHQAIEIFIALVERLHRHPLVLAVGADVV